MGIFSDALDNAILDEKLDALDPDFVIESIKTQLKNPLDNKIKRNYLKQFEKKYKKIKEQDEYDLNIDATRASLHMEIIHRLEDLFGMEVETEYADVAKLTKHLYKFFVVDLVDNIEQFLEMYIVTHSSEVAGMIDVKSNNVTMIAMKDAFEDEDMAIIASNIADAISAIVNSPITFETFVETIMEHPDASGSAEEIYAYHEKNISEGDTNLYESIMQPLVKEEEGFSSILNNVQLKICKRFAKKDYL